ncbi:MAG TPA: Uma2 family endonuclease [Geminicoccaceae bacterium]|nr:Uma2 family endonuclease [Geminicoccaceae bacterium]
MEQRAEQPERMTVAEFLAYEGEPDVRYELVRGEPVAMAPGSNAHGLITGNAWGEIDRRLAERSPCRAQVEAGIAIDAENFFVADVAATCAEHDAERWIVDPFLIVEVLSPSTSARDLAVKLPAYKELPCVREIWLIDSRRRWVEMWHRDEAGWTGRDYIGGASFASLMLDDRVTLDRLYRNTAL